MAGDLLKTTIGDLLDRQAARFGERDALIHVEHGVRYTYGEFRDECNRVAKGLIALGIRKGDHVGIWATNYAEWVVAQFATAKIGAVLVTVNPSYRTHELEYLLKQSDASTLLLIDSFKTSDYVGMINELIPELRESEPGDLHSAKFPQLQRVIFIGQERHAGMLQWSDLAALGTSVSDVELARRQAECGPDEVINIQYTSGTTGFPKGAMLTHFNIVGDAFYIAECMRFTEQDRLCIPVPFYHCFGCVLGTLCCVTHGAAMVIPSEYFDPLKALTAVEKESCTGLHGVPTMFIAELQHPDFAKFSFPALRTGIMAGSPCPIEVMKQVVERMGAAEITIAYGQTESSPVITQTRTDDPIELRVSTVGRALPNVAVKIVDPETGQELPPGQQGELCTRGFIVMKGYYNLPEATTKAIDPDGWLHTGDLATMDERGYCKITGRLKDMIIRGGENIYPREIEEFLYTNPKVADVQVVGVPDLKYGEEVMAWVKLKEGQSATPEEIRDFCRGKIAHYKVPRYVKFVNDFPMTVTGKIQKYKMRDAAVEELGLHEAARVATA
ncbi:MAG: AMP-binding protein [Kouleothrix sp.]|nr:AMP-binding protein [Kouleothrix sp.]